MKTPVRAKFRCLEIVDTTTWRGTDVVVKLHAVCAKDVQYRDGRRFAVESPENAKFWDASPDGSSTLTFPSRDAATAAGFEAGAYYYIDLLDPSEKSEGSYDAVTNHVKFWAGHQINIVVWGSPHNLQLEIGVQNPGAIPPLVDPFLALHAENREDFGRRKWAAERREDRWAVKFTRTDAGAEREIPE